METLKSQSARNRRNNMRKTARGSVKVECRRGSSGFGKNVAEQFLDISEGGVRLSVSEELERGSEVEIQIQGINIKKPIKRAGKICWVVTLQGGHYCIGVEFLKRLAYQEVFQLGRP